MTRRSLWLDRLLILFEGLFLLVGFLQYSSLTFGRPIISWVQWPTLALGGVLVLIRLIGWKQYYKTPALWLFLLFAVSYAVSSVFNLKYGWYDNFRFLVFLGFQITLLYPNGAGEAVTASLKRWEIFSWLFVAGTAVLSLLSFVFLFTGYAKMFEQELGPTYYIGFWWGRLFGAYWDPNIGAVMAVMSAVLSAFLLMKYRALALRILLGFNLAVQLLYVEFSDSRAAKIVLVLGVMVMTYLFLLPVFRERKGWQRQLLALAIAVVLAAAILALLMGCGRLFNAISTSIDPGSALDPNATAIGREADIASDISNRRFDIWKSAWDLFKTSPVVGVSHGNIIEYAKANLPDTYIINNDHMAFGTMHNVVVDVLVSQGVIGVLFFLIGAIWMAVTVFRRTAAFFASEHFRAYATAFTLVVVAVVSSLFMTELVYVISPLTLLFWVSVGTLIHGATRVTR